ncbi:MAG: FAD-dependent oxidoreductase [Rhodopirellula sp.]|nr:FAD-dependent oxidoreductase [Rhodopirellula sp.]
MPLRVSNLQLPVEAPETDLPIELGRLLGVDPGDFTTCRILRKSLDARQRFGLKFVYTVAVELPTDAQRRLVEKRLPNVDIWQPTQFDDPLPGREALEYRPVVVGSGPAGILAGLYLAQKGYRPLIVERGCAVKERVPAIRRFDSGGPFESHNNYLFGEGGAGTFSDGKLTCRLTGSDVDWVLQQFADCSGKPAIVYENRPHLGSNRLPMVVRNFRRRIEQLGGEYRFECCVEGLDVCDGRVTGLQTSSGQIPTSRVILGIGHSARDTYQQLFDQGVPFEQKAFQLGLRIEQPQEQINRHKYGKPEYESILGAADYTLTAKGQRDVYSFCMCAGGEVIPSISEPGYFCSNGMSSSRHNTPFANSGLMVTLEPHEFGSEHPLAGVEVQRKFEATAFRLGGGDYFSPIQSANDFLQQRTPDAKDRLPSSYARGTVPASLDQVLPPIVVAAIRKGLPIMDKKWQGEFLKNATLVGPEMRGSSPVRISRDRVTFETPGFAGLYPVGEGAGYAGGIITAAVDGLRAAREIVRRFAPMQ